MKSLEDQIQAQYEFAYSKFSARQFEWSSGCPSPGLVRLVLERAIYAGQRVLDVGCGLGSDSIFLAANGFSVTALDYSKSAIQRARAGAKAYGVKIKFLHRDFFDECDFGGPYDIAIDRGMLHSLFAHQDACYRTKMATHLRFGGMLVLMTLAECDKRKRIPRRLSSDELITALHSSFTLERLERVRALPTPGREQSFMWFSLWRRRRQPKGPAPD